VLSSDLPKKPQIVPTGVPIPAAMTTTPKPTSSETRAPYKTRGKLAVLPCLYGRRVVQSVDVSKA
jgi:hypothetical protein